MARSFALLVLAVLVAGISGCSTAATRADRYFEAGQLSRAIAAYEEVLASEPIGPARSRALFFLALLYGSPEGQVADLPRGLDLFHQLVEETPGSPYASLVARSLSLDRRLEELQRQVETLQEKASRCRDALTEVGQDLNAAELEMATRTEELRDREADLRKLKEELTKTLDEKEDREKQMRRLTEALELLKQIDLQGKE